MSEKITGAALQHSLAQQAAGNTEPERRRAIREAHAKIDEARVRVDAWVALQKQRGQDANVTDAPAWAQYQAAEAALSELVGAQST